MYFDKESNFKVIIIEIMNEAIIELKKNGEIERIEKNYWR